MFKRSRHFPGHFQEISRTGNITISKTTFVKVFKGILPKRTNERPGKKTKKKKNYQKNKNKDKKNKIKKEIFKMESWLSDVQRVRIPRPKFGSGNSVRRSNSSVQHVRLEILSRQGQDVAKATEELRQALQEKL